MQRGSGKSITGWAAILLAPVAIVVALVGRALGRARSVDRTPDEVAGYLRDFLDGTGGEWDWDDFESVAITDSGLDDIRRRAALAGPPNSDVETLRRLLAETEAFAAGRGAGSGGGA